MKKKTIIMLGRNGDNESFTVLINELKEQTYEKSATKAIMKAINYYTKDRKRLEAENRKLSNDLSEKIDTLDEFLGLLKIRNDSERKLSRFFLNYNKNANTFFS